MTRRFASIRVLAALMLPMGGVLAQADDRPAATGLNEIFRTHDLTILGDVKHGVAARVGFFASEELFEAMAAEVLGRQAMGVETEADVEAFAQDIIRSQRWHFVDPDHPNEVSVVAQHRVASALGRQVLLARRYGINPIFYDFNNPLGGFRTINDPVYRCLADLSTMTWVRYGLRSCASDFRTMMSWRSTSRRR